MDAIKFKFKCVTEDAWVYMVKENSEGEPTTCPNDTGHQIDADSIVRVDDCTEAVQLIKPASFDLIKTTRRMRTKGESVAVAQEDTTAVITFSVPYDVDMVCAKVFYPGARPQDYMETYVKLSGHPDYGTTTQAHSENDTVINVSDEIMSVPVLGPGLFLEISGQEYEIVSFDSSAKTVTLRTGLAGDVASGAGIKVMEKLSESYWLTSTEEFPICTEIEEYMGLTPDWEFNFKFHFPGGAPAADTIRMKLSYVM